MSSRQEEKERRRLERIERERAEAAAAKRKRLAMVAGGAIVAVVAVVLTISSGDKDTSTEPSAGAPIPARKVTNLQQAVKAAGCKLGDFPEESREHIADNETFDGYKTNPPTSGIHHQTPAPDGVYDAGNEPAKESWVHTLEHGRILLQYKPTTPKRVVAQLQTLFNEQVKGAPNGYHMVLLQNNTKMPFQVAAVAWRHYVGCNAVNNKIWDALRAFRDTYVDMAPEAVP
jgi:hypothetical protein